MQVLRSELAHGPVAVGARSFRDGGRRAVVVDQVLQLVGNERVVGWPGMGQRGIADVYHLATGAGGDCCRWVLVDAAEVARRAPEDRVEDGDSRIAVDARRPRLAESGRYP